MNVTTNIGKSSSQASGDQGSALSSAQINPDETFGESLSTAFGTNREKVDLSTEVLTSKPKAHAQSILEKKLNSRITKADADTSPPTNSPFWQFPPSEYISSPPGQTALPLEAATVYSEDDLAGEPVEISIEPSAKDASSIQGTAVLPAMSPLSSSSPATEKVICSDLHSTPVLSPAEALPEKTLKTIDAPDSTLRIPNKTIVSSTKVSSTASTHQNQSTNSSTTSDYSAKSTNSASASDLPVQVASPPLPEFQTPPSVGVNVGEISRNIFGKLTLKGNADSTTSSNPLKPSAKPLPSKADDTTPSSEDQASGHPSPTQPTPLVVGSDNQTQTVDAHVQAGASTPHAPAAARPIETEVDTNTTSDVNPATPTPPQALPPISTSRLIQSLGQTEMRVGMHSTEFGNISIRTSSTPELISAQISLDHSDLAKVLSTHLTEIQAKLSGSQAADIQIEMSGSATSNDSSNTSSQDPRQSKTPIPERLYNQGNRQNNGAETGTYSPAITTVSNRRGNALLDVRV